MIQAGYIPDETGPGRFHPARQMGINAMFSCDATTAQPSPSVGGLEKMCLTLRSYKVFFNEKGMDDAEVP